MAHRPAADPDPLPAPDFSVRRFLFPRIHPEGWKFVAAVFLLGAAADAALAGFGVIPLHAAAWIGVFLLALSYGVYMFFRDPVRHPPPDPSAVLSPADGFVCLLGQVPVPEELSPASSEPVWRVSVFMSVLDVHVNRMPLAATIAKKHYVPGKFFNASLDKASKDNERMLYLARTPSGLEFAFVQIAGLVARRIVPFAREGDTLARGERFGLIRFGSRVDVYLPPGVEPLVSIGQTMVAGETPIARIP